MKLYQFQYSPYAAKVRFCLAFKGLSCEVVEVPYARRAELISVSGGMGIPVLVDGEQVISDSARIAAHLDAKGEASLRVDPLSVVLEQWSDSTLEDAAFRFACPGLEERIGADQGEEALQLFRLIKERKYGAGIIAQWKSDAAKWLGETKALLQPIVELVSHQQWVLKGPMPSVADAAIAGQLHMLESAQPGIVARELPGLVKWFDRVRSGRT